MNIVRRMSLAWAAVIAIVTPLSAFAQSADSRWDIQVHAGGLSGTGGVRGTTTLPAPEPYDSGFNQTSRRVASWYFGDGARLFNEVSAAFRRPQLVSLDPILNGSVVERKQDARYGISVSRRLTDRLRGEFSFDYLGRTVLNDRVVTAVELSRAAFEPAFERLAFSTQTSATSVATVDTRGGPEFGATASVVVDVLRGRRVVPFLTAGGGMAWETGNPAQIELRGEYAISVGSFPGLPPIVQRDNVRVTYRAGDRALLGVVGGGVRVALSPHWVLQTAVRAYLRDSDIEVRLDANPATEPVSNISLGASISNAANVALVFSAGQGPVRRDSSLREPGLQGYVAFAGRELQTRFSVTTGLGWRF